MFLKILAFSMPVFVVPRLCQPDARSSRRQWISRRPNICIHPWSLVTMRGPHLGPFHEKIGLSWHPYIHSVHAGSTRLRLPASRSRAWVFINSTMYFWYSSCILIKDKMLESRANGDICSSPSSSIVLGADLIGQWSSNFLLCTDLSA